MDVKAKLARLAFVQEWSDEFLAHVLLLWRTETTSHSPACYCKIAA